jgi:hypothetical protein
MARMTLILILGLLIGTVVAFVPQLNHGVARKNNALAPLQAQKGEKDVGEKLIYDSNEVRLYERNLAELSADEFMLIDEETKQPILLTKEEKERIFMDAVQSFYFGKSTLSDEQFDSLKNDLSWEGSNLVTLNRNESLFIRAVQAWNKKEPILSDAEFDELKLSLKDANSPIAVSTEPKCYVDSGICKVTWVEDKFLTSSLYVPAGLIGTILYLGIGYELPVLGNLNPIPLLLLGAPLLFSVTRAVTKNVFFSNPLVAMGSCPSCGTENRVLFGDVLGVEGDKKQSTIKCSNCKSALTIKRSTLRVSTLLKEPAKPKPAPKPLVKAE